MGGQEIRTRRLQSAEFIDLIIIESEEFPDVAYEIKGKAMRVMIFAESGTVQFAGTFKELKRFFSEGLEIIKEWEEL